MPFGTTSKGGRKPIGDRALTAAERIEKHRKKGRAIERRPCADPKRRARLERNPAKWREFYCYNPKSKPDGLSHKEIIKGVQKAVSGSTGIAVAAPRGDGKTTTLWNMALYLLATGVIRFPVIVRYTAVHARATFKRSVLATFGGTLGKAFQADYPELTQAFEVSTNPKAMERLTWADTDEPINATVDSSCMTIVLPDGKGAIASVSAKSDTKGLQIIMPDGDVLRPDLLLIDDAQDVKRADNPTAIADQVDILENVFLGMAGPQTPLMVFVACTVESEGDVSCHWLNRPGFESVRIPRIITWPGGGVGGGWDTDNDDKQRALWDEWWQHYKDDGHAAKNRFFRKHRKAMCAKMEVSWKHRKRPRLDVSAYDAAMFDYYDKGASVFSRAQQNMPIREGVTIYNLTPDIIMARADKARKAGEIPEWSRLVVAATDINPSYALSTVIMAIGEDQRAAVLWYGKHELQSDDTRTDAQVKAYIMAELEKHGSALASLPCRPERWIIDGGGTPQDTVIGFAGSSIRTTGLEATCSFGRSWNYVRPRKGDRTFEHGYIRAESRARRWIIYNSDYWHELAQRAWLAAIGAPGSCDLPAGKHDEFAQQVCGEWLKDKAELAGGWAYKWERVPGPHDFGDCVYMAFAMAAASGIGTGGQAPRRVLRRPRTGVTVIPM